MAAIQLQICHGAQPDHVQVESSSPCFSNNNNYLIFMLHISDKKWSNVHYMQVFKTEAHINKNLDYIYIYVYTMYAKNEINKKISFLTDIQKFQHLSVSIFHAATHSIVVLVWQNKKIYLLMWLVALKDGAASNKPFDNDLKL
mgnify:CR=1 FL=1